jgi:short-subunit dehydrogenase
MPLSRRKIVLSGSSGGIGQFVGARLLERGASLATISRSASGLPSARHLTADLSSEAGRKSAVSFVEDEQPDVLINLAGVQYFGPAEQQSGSDVEATYAVNLIAPVLLSRAVLPAMKRKRSGQIVNIGSILGSIGFAYFATYSSSKAGLRLFSEALRRELADTGIVVTYVAPRAARTGLITRKVAQYADLTKMAIDEPDGVAIRLVDAVERGDKEVFFGGAERFFVKVNGVLPRLVDFLLANNDRKASALFAPQNFVAEEPHREHQ